MGAESTEDPGIATCSERIAPAFDQRGFAKSRAANNLDNLADALIGQLKSLREPVELGFPADKASAMPRRVGSDMANKSITEPMDGLNKLRFVAVIL